MNVKNGLTTVRAQCAIAHVLRTVDRKIEAEDRRKAALQVLFQALLRDLMTGRRRLPPEFVAQFESIVGGAL